MFAVDISFNQVSIDWAGLASNIELVIGKAGGGESGSFHQDSQWIKHRDGCRSIGRTLGSYFFNGPVDPTAAAEWYVSIIDYRPGDFVALDVESSSGVARWSAAQALTFAARVKALIGVAPAIYMSSSVLFEDDWQPLVDLGCPLWVASYGADDGSEPSQPALKFWAAWTLWQFSSVSSHAGLPGSIDTNEINDALLSAYLNTSKPEPKDGFTMASLEDLNAAIKPLVDAVTTLTGIVKNISGSPELQAQYVQQINAQYSDILGRDADPIGLTGFLAFMIGGGSLDAIRTSIFGSREYGDLWLTKEYHACFGPTRTPSLDDLSNWWNWRTAGGHTYDDVTAAIKASPEYLSTHSV